MSNNSNNKKTIIVSAIFAVLLCIGFVVYMVSSGGVDLSDIPIGDEVNASVSSSVYLDYESVPVQSTESLAESSAEQSSTSSEEASIVQSEPQSSSEKSEPQSSSEKSEPQSSSEKSEPQFSSEKSEPQSSSSNPEVQSTLKFRNSNLLNQHYQKHGIEMGFASAKEYEKAAAAVPLNPAALHKTEKEDGDDVYYVEATNEFVIVSTDGFIRTYFLPSAGLAYFERQ